MSSKIRDKSLIQGNPYGAVLPADMGGQDAAIQVGGPWGLAFLNETGELPGSVLPASLTGGVVYKGTWNASEGNPPHLQPEKGWYYVVSVEGATNLDGITDWKVSDWAIFNGVQWQKVDNSEGVVGDPPFVVEDYAGTSRTLVAADKNKLIRCTSDAAVTLSVAAGLPANWKCDVMQDGAGQVTIAGAVGVTMRASDDLVATSMEGAVIGVARIAPNRIVVYGDRA